MYLIIVNYLIHFISVILLHNSILHKNVDKIRVVLSTLVLFCCLFIASGYTDNDLVIYFVFSLACQLFLWKISIQKVKFKSLIYMTLLLYLIKLIFLYTITALFALSNNRFRVLEFVIHILLLAFSLLCYNKRIRNFIQTVIFSASKTIKILFLFLLLFCTTNVALMKDIQFFVSTNDIAFITQTISITSILFIGIAFPVIVLISTANTHLKNLTKNYEQQIEAQAVHYSELSKSNLEIRKFRHDLKNIKIGVSQLLKEGKQEEALKMLEVAEGENNAVLAFDTGNGIVDALLADKQKKAEPNNIKIDFNGAIPTEAITPTDLCVIFGNTIDNAMEACGKLDDNADKTIKVECKCSSGFMFLNMSNPVDKPVAIKSNKIKTTKVDKSLHGFGLYSLDKVVKKHNGEMKLSCDNNIFVLDISLCLKQVKVK